MAANVPSLVFVRKMSSLPCTSHDRPAALDLGGTFRISPQSRGWHGRNFPPPGHRPGMSTAHRSAPVRQSPPNRINRLNKRLPRLHPRRGALAWLLWVVLGGVLLGTLLHFHPGIGGSTTRQFSYSGFVSEVTANKVSTATISSTGLVSGKLDNGVAYTFQIPTALNDNALSRSSSDTRSSDQEPVRALSPWRRYFLLVAAPAPVGLFVWFAPAAASRLAES